jgi:hypothetical protein
MNSRFFTVVTVIISLSLIVIHSRMHTVKIGPDMIDTCRNSNDGQVDEHVKAIRHNDEDNLYGTISCLIWL